MTSRQQPRAIAMPSRAVPGPTIDYLKLAVWCAGIVLPWTALAVLMHGASALLP